MALTFTRNSELSMNSSKPYVILNNAHTEVSVSSLFRYRDTIVYIQPHEIKNLELSILIAIEIYTNNIYMVRRVDTRPLTKAEKVLYLK